MSTKAELESYVTKLQEQIGQLKGEAHASINLQGRGQEQLTKLQTQRDHYRAQRDQLVGFIQGMREGSNEDLLVDESLSTNAMEARRPYRHHTKTDQFIDRMQSDSDGSVLF